VTEEIKRPELPEQENLAVAIKLAQEKLRQLSLAEIASTTGAEYLEKEKLIRLTYFNKKVDIIVPDFTMKYSDGRDIMEWEQVLVLHYLLTDLADKPVGELMAFIEIPDGHFYNDTFLRRSRNPIVDTFGDEPEKLLEAGKLLGAKQVEHGDIAIDVDAFPNIPLTVLIWKGDEEFPPDGNVLFRSDISRRLAIEDIVVVANLLAIKLKIAKAKSGG